MIANIGWRDIWDDAYSHYFKNNESLCKKHEMCTNTKYYASPKSEACPECAEKLKGA